MSVALMQVLLFVRAVRKQMRLRQTCKFPNYAIPQDHKVWTHMSILVVSFRKKNVKQFIYHYGVISFQVKLITQEFYSLPRVP